MYTEIQVGIDGQTDGQSSPRHSALLTQLPLAMAGQWKVSAEKERRMGAERARALSARELRLAGGNFVSQFVKKNIQNNYYFRMV